MSDEEIAIFLPSDVSIPEAYRIGKQRAYMEFVEKLENIIPKRGWWDSDMVQDNIEDLIDLYKEKSKNK